MSLVHHRSAKGDQHRVKGEVYNDVKEGATREKRYSIDGEEDTAKEDEDDEDEEGEAELDAEESEESGRRVSHFVHLLMSEPLVNICEYRAAVKMSVPQNRSRFACSAIASSAAICPSAIIKKSAV